MIPIFCAQPFLSQQQKEDMPVKNWHTATKLLPVNSPNLESQPKKWVQHAAVTTPSESLFSICDLLSSRQIKSPLTNLSVPQRKEYHYARKREISPDDKPHIGNPVPTANINGTRSCNHSQLVWTFFCISLFLLEAEKEYADQYKLTPETRILFLPILSSKFEPSSRSRVSTAAARRQ